MRQLGVWLAALVLFASALPLHSGLEQHDALGSPTQVFATHCKPGPACHLEPTSEIELPRCPACTLQLRSVGALVPASAAIPVPLPVGVAPQRPLALLAQAPRALVASRGPPRG
jgi:hypothetical protein